MGKDYQSFVNKERKNEGAGAKLPEVQSGNSFVIGLNSVMRALERKELQIVIISGKVKKLFVQHITTSVQQCGVSVEHLTGYIQGRTWKVFRCQTHHCVWFTKSKTKIKRQIAKIAARNPQ